MARISKIKLGSTTYNIGLKTGVIGCNISSLSSYWGKAASFNAIDNANVDYIFLIGYTHSGTDAYKGIIGVNVRKDTFTKSVGVLMLCGNIPTANIRIYYNNTDNVIQLWINTRRQWTYVATTVLHETSLSSVRDDITLYNTTYTTVQTLPSMSYVEPTVIKPDSLANTRTIWGQNFDGSANVSGALSGATTITASDYVTAKGYKIPNGTNSQIFRANGNVIDDNYIVATQATHSTITMTYATNNKFIIWDANYDYNTTIQLNIPGLTNNPYSFYGHIIIVGTGSNDRLSIELPESNGSYAIVKSYGISTSKRIEVDSRETSHIYVIWNAEIKTLFITTN